MFLISNALGNFMIGTDSLHCQFTTFDKWPINHLIHQDNCTEKRGAIIRGKVSTRDDTLNIFLITLNRLLGVSMGVRQRATERTRTPLVVGL